MHLTCANQKVFQIILVQRPCVCSLPRRVSNDIKGCHFRHIFLKVGFSKVCGTSAKEMSCIAQSLDGNFQLLRHIKGIVFPLASVPNLGFNCQIYQECEGFHGLVLLFSVFKLPSLHMCCFSPKFLLLQRCKMLYHKYAEGREDTNMFVRLRLHEGVNGRCHNCFLLSVVSAIN